MRTKNQNKKIKYIISIVGIILFIGLLVNFGLLPATLYGGGENNEFAGYETVTANSQSGSTITNFAESNIDSVEISLTNSNGFTDSKTIWIKPTGEALTNYQKKIEIVYDSDMQIDFDDVRFFQNDVSLDYTLIEKVDSTSAVFYVEIPTIDADTGANIKMIYGNANLESASITPNTFFYAYFDGDGTGWTEVDPNSHITFANDRLEFSGLHRDEVAYVYQQNTDIISENTIIEYEATITTQSSGLLIMGGVFDGLDHYSAMSNGYGDLWSPSSTGVTTKIMNGGSSVSGTAVGVSLNTPYYIRQFRNGNTLTTYVYSDSARTNLVGSGTLTQSFTDTNVQYIYLVQSAYTGASASTISGWIDNVIVRKHGSTEPDYYFIDSFTATKYKEVTINPSTDGTLYHFQHFLDDVAYDDDMQSDFEDLRFTYNGIPIPHNIESYVASTSADIYVNVPEIDSSTGATIRMWYGDGTASSGSDSKATFPLYDNFDDNSIDTSIWVDELPTVNTITEQNGRLELVGSTTDKMHSNLAFTKGYELQGDFSWITTNKDQAHFRIDDIVDSYASITSRNTDVTNYRIQTLDSGSSETDYYSSIPNGKRVSIVVAENGDVLYRYKEIGAETWSSFNQDGNIADNDPFHVRFAISKQTDDSGDLTAYIDNVVLLKYADDIPTSSIGAEQTASPSITSDFTISCTGDSDSQTYGVETKNVILTPSGDILQFDIVTSSLDYDFIAKLHHSGITTVTAENATEGTMSIEFTPTLNIEEGYVNAKFTENVSFTNPSITADLNGEEIENVTLTNNTLSMELLNIVAQQHTANFTITESVIPTVPSSGGGGGGSSYVPPVDDEINEETNTVIETVSEQLEKDEIFDLLNDNTQAQMIIVIFVVLGLFGFILYRGKK